MDALERTTAVTGIGQSDVGRRLGRDPLELTIDACLQAIEDAGLTRERIDGLATYPGAGVGTAGFAGPGVPEVQDALRLELDWFSGGPETSGQLGSVINAIAAVATGLCRHVLCYRTVTEGSAQKGGGRKGIGMSGGRPGGASGGAAGGGKDDAKASVEGESEAGRRAAGGAGGRDRGGSRKAFRARGMLQWTLPFGASSAANWLALVARRHFHEHGTTRAQMGWVAINARANAALNPKAIYRDPMTLEDYLAARMISTPFGLYDCDVPCDGSTAVIVSRLEEAADLAHPPVRVESVGSALRGRPSWDQGRDLTTMANHDAAAMLWERTDLRPADVEVAELYDGFSFLTLSWLEALGFCGVGESGPFVDGGERIALGGELPLNTQGGQLSAGRLHGYGMLHEAIVQLRGAGGERQVRRGPAGHAPRVAVAAAGGGPLAGCLLLAR